MPKKESYTEMIKRNGSEYIKRTEFRWWILFFVIVVGGLLTVVWESKASKEEVKSVDNKVIDVRIQLQRECDQIRKHQTNRFDKIDVKIDRLIERDLPR